MPPSAVIPPSTTVRLLPVIDTEPVNWWAIPPPAVSLAPGVEPDPNILLPVNTAETPSMKLNPLNEKIFPPRAKSPNNCILEAVTSPEADISPLTVKPPPIIGLFTMPIWVVFADGNVTSISLSVPIIEAELNNPSPVYHFLHLQLLLWSQYSMVREMMLFLLRRYFHLLLVYYY